MPLPTNEKSWQFDVNRTVAASGAVLTTSRTLWRQIALRLQSIALLPWVCRYSCDSVAAGTPGDLTDRWAADTNLVWATADASGVRSWKVLRNTDGVEILLECRANSAVIGKGLRIVMSPAAHFTGGTTTTRPTATDEVILVSGDSAATSAIGAGTTSNSTDSAYAFHVLHSTDGLVTMVVLCCGNVTSSIWYFGRVSAPVTGWSLPVIAMVCGASAAGASAANGAGYTELFDQSNTDATNPKMVARFTAGVAGRIRLGSIGMSNTPGTPNACEPAGVVVATQNELSAEWELPQVTVGSALSGARGFAHGRLFDVRWVSSGRSTGDTFPLDGSRTRAVFGSFVIPWNGSSPVTA